jgi:RimJ/RimL family protein N-acetyltransferase
MTWIETERLILRDLDENDFDAWARMAADPKIMQFLGRDGKTDDREAAWRSLAMIVGHRALRGYSFFAVEEKETGDYVGRVGPWMPEGWTDLEIGWAIDSSRWGRGYAIEAARAAADWTHKELKADHVIHYIVPDNARSQSVAKKLGGQITGKHMLFGTLEVDVWRTELS